MRIRKRTPSLLLAVVAVLILLLPLLAYLQYDWLGKVSEREREQMQTALRNSLIQVSQDFDREIARMFIQFENWPDRTDPWDAEYAKVYAHWLLSAPYPKLIHAIFLEESDANGVQRLRRLRMPSGSWEPSDWIPEFGARRELASPIDAQVPALVIPIFEMPPGSPEPIFALPKNVGRIILRLDLEYIRKDFVPALVRSHFPNAISEYRLEIRDRQDAHHIIYSSEPAARIHGEGDAAENILTLRLDEFRALRPAGITFAEAPEAGIRTDQVFSVHVMHGFSHSLPAENFTGMDFNSWRITAAHRSGSLDAAVGQLRRRNLAVSFSILALLAASVAVVLASTARAQRLARQQMEFVSAVSHELRTPLAVIRSAGENLADGVVREPDQLKSYGKVIRNEGRRLTEMVEQVLSFAGIQSGMKKETFMRVDMSNVLERALDAFEIPMRENGFTVERHIPEHVPLIIGDPLSLSRAIQNLISNAIKYSGLNRWIGLSIYAEGRWLKLAVQDCGMGISSSDLPHIFEPFYRGRSAVDGQIQGSGLGLSLVKQTMESHGGSVDVTSNPGSGSTFYISLPIAQTPEISSE